MGYLRHCLGKMPDVRVNEVMDTDKVGKHFWILIRGHCGEEKEILFVLIKEEKEEASVLGFWKVMNNLACLCKVEI